ncbi:ataxia telangiectasia mutated family protein [Tanacetum coccineum]
MSEKLMALDEDMSARNTDQMWNTLASVIRDVAKESLGVASELARTHSTHRESWWFGEEVQTKVAPKKSRFKELLAGSDCNQDDIDLAKERYKVAKKEAKIAVAQAKDKAYEDLYRKLDSKEGANDIYKIAKARERKKGYRKQRSEGCITKDGEKQSHRPRPDSYRSLEMPGRRGGEVADVEVGLHQGSSINPYLFTLILDELSRGIQESIPWCMIFAYDIVLIVESAKGLNNRIEKWREALEDNGLRILQPNESFMYLGSMIHRSGRIDEDVAHRIGVGSRLDQLCYMAQNASRSRKLKQIGAELDVDSIIDKMREGRLRWFGHVNRRPETSPVRRVEAMLVEGSRRRGSLAGGPLEAVSLLLGLAWSGYLFDEYQLTDVDAEWNFASNRILLDILEAFPSAKHLLGIFFAVVALRLQSRLYSIPSSLKMAPDMIYSIDTRMKASVGRAQAWSWRRTLGNFTAAYDIYVPKYNLGNIVQKERIFSGETFDVDIQGGDGQWLSSDFLATDSPRGILRTQMQNFRVYKMDKHFYYCSTLEPNVH